MKYRIVSKSVPSLGLIKEIRAATGSDRLMVFHQPHMNIMAATLTDTEWLLGKPMPAGAAKRFFADHKPNNFDVARQIEWLIDTPTRLAEYRELALAQLPKDARLRVNFEVDVGLHRGGFATPADLAEALRTLKGDPKLEFSGLMGYEAFVSHVPDAMGGPANALAEVIAKYRGFMDAGRDALGDAWRPEQLTLNMGGSSTYELYNESAPANDMSVGSGLVKPTDFDTKTLADHQPACFIGTPVLKAIDNMNLPGYEGMTSLFRAWDPNMERTFYTYGGYWLANAVSPPGLQRNNIWGHSTNQDMLNGSRDVQLKVGDYVFYRPHQSEFVFLQFGDIAVFENGKITESWPVFAG
jgi:D-serine deaminase-like pyridoxal phosphate-dependent protein